ncbi:hypothetical protein JHK85_050912 [Glycine max]|nr:hypothetical protein JHK86_050119 [Glycine max]KAG4935993.1 hypothetical protein JHK85_050912 [Glycine max]
MYGLLVACLILMFGHKCSVWVARRPPGYAFIEFDDRRDALDAIQALDGKNGWRVELSHNSKGGGRGGRGRGGEGTKCYECGEPGHFARECRLRIGSRGLGSGRRRSPSPYRRRRSPSYGYDRRSYSPRGRRSPRRRSISLPRGRSYSRSPPYRPSRHDSPYANACDYRPKQHRFTTYYILSASLLHAPTIERMLHMHPTYDLEESKGGWINVVIGLLHLCEIKLNWGSFSE